MEGRGASAALLRPLASARRLYQLEEEEPDEEGDAETTRLQDVLRRAGMVQDVDVRSRSRSSALEDRRRETRNESDAPAGRGSPAVATAADSSEAA